MLHDGADGAALLAAIEARADLVDLERAGRRPVAAAAGDTTYLCTADATGMAVSLIQSNAVGLRVVAGRADDRHQPPQPRPRLQPRSRATPPSTGPGARPPHTLCPAMATRDGELAAVFGTMGGDAQPQILLQVAARLFAHGASPGRRRRGAALGAARRGRPASTRGRAAARRRSSSRATRRRRGAPGSRERGHAVDVAPPFDSGFGHAHAIVVEPTGAFAAAADPRARVGSAAGV